jgi:hypothetical protein
MRPTVRLGVVPSDVDQILFTGMWQTPDKVDKVKGPKTFALGPLSLKLRWLVSKFFYCSYNKKSGKPIQLQRQNNLCLFLSPHIA